MADAPKRKVPISPNAHAEFRRGVEASNYIARTYPRTVRFSPEYPDKLRAKAIAALSLLGIAVEHHVAVLRLVEQNMRTSAFALARPIESGRYNHDAIERQLAHTPDDKVRAIYNRATYLAERTQMMQDWADWLDRIGQGDACHAR